MKVVIISIGKIIIIIPNKIDQSKGGNPHKTIKTYQCSTNLNLVAEN
jgi:hypothetical protein